MKRFKIKMYTNPEYMGSDVDMNVGKGLPTNQIKLDKIYLFEPQDKMEIPSSRELVQKLVSDIRNGKQLKPIFVRTYQDGYQIIDGHHRYQAYKLANKDTIPAKIIPNKYIQIIKEELANTLQEINLKKYGGLAAASLLALGGSSKKAVASTQDQNISGQDWKQEVINKFKPIIKSIYDSKKAQAIQTMNKPEVIKKLSNTSGYSEAMIKELLKELDAHLNTIELEYKLSSNSSTIATYNVDKYNTGRTERYMIFYITKISPLLENGNTEEVGHIIYHEIFHGIYEFLETRGIYGLRSEKEKFAKQVISKDIDQVEDLTDKDAQEYSTNPDEIASRFAEIRDYYGVSNITNAKELTQKFIKRIAPNSNLSFFEGKLVINSQFKKPSDLSYGKRKTYFDETLESFRRNINLSKNNSNNMIAKDVNRTQTISLFKFLIIPFISEFTYEENNNIVNTKIHIDMEKLVKAFNTLAARDTKSKSLPA